MTRRLDNPSAKSQEAGKVPTGSRSNLKLIKVRIDNKHGHQWAEPVIARPSNRRPPYKSTD